MAEAKTNDARKRWSELSQKEKADRIAIVLTKAGAEENFRKACLDRKTGQETVAQTAGVIFDGGEAVRCFADQKAAEHDEIILVLPDYAKEAGAQHRPEDGTWWLCTYHDYRD